MKHKYVIIVNGEPGVGKTLMSKMAAEYIEDCVGTAHICSSIDPIKEIAHKLGWDGKKNDKWRKALCDMKRIWIDTCDGPTQWLVNRVLDNTDNTGFDQFFFVDIREPDEIRKAVQVLSPLNIIGVHVCTILVVRRLVSAEHGNAADDGVYNYKYDHTINNDSDEVSLRNNIVSIIKSIMEDNKDEQE